MDNQPTGEPIEMFGIAVAVVNKDLIIEDLSVYYDPNPVLTKGVRIKYGRGGD